MAWRDAVSSLCAPPRTPSPRRPRAAPRRLIEARVPDQLCWRQQRGSSSRTTWSQLFERLRTAAACAAPEAACGQRFGPRSASMSIGEVSKLCKFRVRGHSRPRCRNASATRPTSHNKSQRFALWPACKTLASRQADAARQLFLDITSRIRGRRVAELIYCCSTGGCVHRS